MLPLVSAQAQRCRDCKHRFHVGVVWSRVVFGGLAALFVGGMITTMALVRASRQQAARQPPPPERRARTRRLLPLPPGLPPLSAVPRPKDDKEQGVETTTDADETTGANKTTGGDKATGIHKKVGADTQR